jgi:uncharacterized protein (DUF983 family)
MDDRTIRDIYAFFVFLAGIILIFGSMFYYGSSLNVPLYINIAIILIVIPAAIDLLGDRIKGLKINKNNG